jgi:pilus assembly protein Flp/PilA
MQTMFSRFWADRSAAIAIEHGLIAAVNGLGSTLNTSFTNLNNSLK